MTETTDKQPQAQDHSVQVSDRNDARQVKRLFLREFRGDQVILTIDLSSPDIQRAYRRHFDGVSRALFYVRFYLRIINNQKIEQELLAEINTLMAGPLEQINQKIQVAEHLLAEANIKSKSGAGQAIKAPVIDPMANRYLQLIVAGDNLARKYNALWQALLLDDIQIRQVNNELGKILRQVHTQATRISLGLRDRVHDLNPLAEAGGNPMADRSSSNDDEEPGEFEEEDEFIGSSVGDETDTDEETEDESESADQETEKAVA